MRLSGSGVKGDNGRVRSVSRASCGDNWSLFGGETVGRARGDRTNTRGGRRTPLGRGVDVKVLPGVIHLGGGECWPTGGLCGSGNVGVGEGERGISFQNGGLDS